jgi:hypothetical protein
MASSEKAREITETDEVQSTNPAGKGNIYWNSMMRYERQAGAVLSLARKRGKSLAF